jgi:hypothetical protein
MPIEYDIDPDRRRVTARIRGTLTDKEVFDYQQDVWSRPELAGYHELIDTSEVERIALPASRRVRDLAVLSAAMDARDPNSKLAIIAPSDLAFGLGRMYQAHREHQELSTKTVAVFRSMEAALEWLEKGAPDAEL